MYFGTPIEDLNLAQWAMIAGLPKAPSAMNPLVNPRRALIRRNWILTRMLDLGYIHKEQYDLAIKAPISATYHGLVSEVNAHYLAETVRRFMVNEYGLDAYKEGLQVFTTIDSELQNLAVRALKKGLETYDKRHGFRSPENYTNIFPENFFDEDLEYRLNLIAESKSLPLGISEFPEQEPLEDVYDLLINITTTDNKFPALVLSVEDNFVALSGDRMVHEIIWAEDLSWARPYINEDQRGPRPKSYSELLKEGDLVWLEKDKIRSSISLTQIPKVQGSIVAMDPKNLSLIHI